MAIKLKAKWIYNTPCSGNPCEFDYVGTTGQLFTAPQTGYYKLETWGAQGGDAGEKIIYSDGTPIRNTVWHGGYGAYAKGTIYLTSGSELYVYVGGKGGDSYTFWDNPFRIDKDDNGNIIRSLYTYRYGGAGGFNGGGKGGNGHGNWSGVGGGGGATHIATVSGELHELENKKGSILIVAAGGGGNISTGGPLVGWKSSGGGYMTKDYTIDPQKITGCSYTKVRSVEGATQTSGHAFGQGQDGRNSTGGGCACNGGSGGGGGWYGGHAITINGIGTGLWRTGGSSYIGSSQLSSKSMYMFNGYSNYDLSGISECASSDEVNTKTVCVTTYDHAVAEKANTDNGYARITWLGTSV